MFDDMPLYMFMRVRHAPSARCPLACCYTFAAERRLGLLDNIDTCSDGTALSLLVDTNLVGGRSRVLARKRYARRQSTRKSMATYARWW